MLAGVALRAIYTTVFLMSDLRFDWHPPLSSPLIDERLELLVQEALKDYKSGSGIQPRATYEASYRAIGKHLYDYFGRLPPDEAQYIQRIAKETLKAAQNPN